ncbi:hypothetical protein [Alicyclobacillus acidoterrestris]|uniref:Uncharacterized protein n=1 Tax=Alicyclobacillus acidoterrestris (strain ATCC 49025 / DSM 3922 / CIP 106132 / NCIMB 13137 / GD3B) TaxID=1356854 RepID=T0C403_ALIAG|nr:hypothetical protein [Alicyclobacillus acidoterrestris]EPZ47744.1 hypothetical protein N007_05675 [Alicyclobacillus acidoterrestris ATCC 49025]UNO47950.1 hypothetical protein K1I37_14845 [Alicyclobacillus acidoterrestris]
MTDAQRLEEIREHLHHNRVLHESDAQFLLSKLDAANRMLAKKNMEIKRLRKELEWIRDHVLWGNADITCIKVHDRAILALFEASRTYAEDGEVDGETE